ncbi:MAG: D-tyrosyl-tRNA(Tyr) deacylase [Clostridia bacterium]|nr:D-tyrosyl-tRNA(Tyr) deacylase [Clostridia bacterium]
MRAVLQRVHHASVQVEGELVGKIGKGLLLFLGVCDEDDQSDISYLADKVLGLRIFEDENEKMNLSLEDVGGDILVVSQFTLFGDCRKGKRPSFSTAGKPDYAEAMYEKFIAYIEEKGYKVQHGIFGADMQVELLNDGPVTLLLDSKKLF